MQPHGVYQEPNRKYQVTVYNAGRAALVNDPRTQAPDLDSLWSRLGVPKDPKTQPFDDHAPLAAIRIAITAPRKS